MADFITPADFTNRVYQEKIDSISNGDAALLPEAIAAAVKEAQLYLSRFDIVDLFSKEGSDRDPLLLQWLKDISIWNFIGLANPGIDYEDSLTRRNLAIATLKSLQSSSAVPFGWNVATNADPTDTSDPSVSIHVASQPKRPTYRS